MYIHQNDKKNSMSGRIRRRVKQVLTGFSCALALSVGAAGEEATVGRPDALIAPDSSFWTGQIGLSTVRSVSDCATNCSVFTDRAAEVQELARALRYDPDLIFEWVYDNVRFNPVFGMQKGALGAVLDRDGTAFDQVDLARQLLEEANTADVATTISSSIEIGTLTLSGAEFDDWTGISDAGAACSFLAAGGFPARVNGATDCSTLSGGISSVEMGHARLRAIVDGQVEIWDPAYRINQHFSGLNLQSAMGFASDSTLSTVTAGASTGSISGVPYISSLNESALAQQLQQRASALETYLENNAFDASLPEIIGGSEVILLREREMSADYLSTADKAVAGTFAPQMTGLASVPDQFRTSLQYHFLGTDWMALEPEIFGPFRTIYMDEFYGRRFGVHVGDINNNAASGADGAGAINIGPYDPVFEAAVQVDGQDIFSFSDGREPSPHARKFVVTFIIDHPYAGVNEYGAPLSYMDEMFLQEITLFTDAVFLVAAGQVGTDQSRRWAQEMGPDGPMPHATTRTHWVVPTIGENPNGFDLPVGSRSDSVRYQYASEWAMQVSRMVELQSRIGGEFAQLHHAFGIVSGSTRTRTMVSNIETAEYLPNIRLEDDATVMNVKIGVSSTDMSGAAATDNVYRAITLAASSLEGSVAEQLFHTPEVASVSERMVWANAPAGSYTYPLWQEGNLSYQTAQEYAGPYRYYFIDNLSDLAAWDALTSTDGDLGVNYAENTLGDFRSILRVAVEDYLNDGYDIVLASDSFLGPGRRCEVPRPRPVKAFEDQLIMAVSDSYEVSSSGARFPSAPWPNPGNPWTPPFPNPLPDFRQPDFLRPMSSRMLGDGYRLTTNYGSFSTDFTPAYDIIEVDEFIPNPETGRQCRPNHGRGGAFIAVHPNGTQRAYMLTGNSTPGATRMSGGGGVDAYPQEIAGLEMPTADSILESQAEDSWNHSIDPQSGLLTYATEALLTTGAGEFPYSLSFSRTLQSGAHVLDASPWSHNLGVTATISHSGMEIMGSSSPRNAIPSIVAFAAMQDIFRPASGAELMRREMAGVFTSQWWADRLSQNVISISAGGSVSRFVRRYDGAFNAPLGSNASLTQTGVPVFSHDLSVAGNVPSPWRRFWKYSGVTFQYRDAVGNVIDFEPWAAEFRPVGTDPGVIMSGDAPMHQGWRATTWSFANGMSLTYEYEGTDDRVRRVTNSLGWGLELSYPPDPAPAPTAENFWEVSWYHAHYPDAVTETASWITAPRTVTFDDETITHADGQITRFVFSGSPNQSRTGEHGSWLTDLYSADRLNANGTIGTALPNFRFGYDALGRGVNFDVLNVSGTGFNRYEYYLALGSRAETLTPMDDTSPQAHDTGDISYFDDYGRNDWSYTRRDILSRNVFDGIGRLVESCVSDDGEPLHCLARTGTQYDQYFNPVQVSQYPAWNQSTLPALVTEYRYNEPGFPTLQTRVIAPGGAQSVTCFSQSTYEAECAGLLLDSNVRGGQPQAAVGPSGEQSLFEYDAYGRLTRSRVLVEN